MREILNIPSDETVSTDSLGPTQLEVSGMTCQNCVRHVTEAIQAFPGVASTSVNLENGRAIVRWDKDVSPDEAALLKTLKEEGYPATKLATADMQAQRRSWSPLVGWRFNVTVGPVLTLPLFVLEWIVGVGQARWYHWLAFSLVLPIQTFCGARFYSGAWNQLRQGRSNMDTLVVLGSTTAFLYSCWALFSGQVGHLFFMESASIITFISVGHWVEGKVGAKAAASLRALLNLAPQMARRRDDHGQETEVAVAMLHVGDTILIRPGDRIPIDSTVVQGDSLADEAMLTGESNPVLKRPGATLYGGTLNLHGHLTAKVSAIGEGTALAQIVAVVQRAQTSRAKIQRLGDQVSNVFVPIVVVIAMLTGLWWGLVPASAQALTAWLGPWLGHGHHPNSLLAAAVYHAAAVLIVACPCAMGLATPIAIMAGTNVAAERGILIRDGMALEKTGGITAVVFDKTGTITEGKLTIVGQEEFQAGDASTPGFQQIAISLARPSAHPLSQAIASQGGSTLPLAEWSEVVGSGVQGNLESEAGAARLRLGSITWLRQLGVDLGLADAFIAKWSVQGATVLGVSADKQLLGVIALRDVIKPDAPRVVRALQRQGKTAWLVTGDNRAVARHIALQTGIDDDKVFAQVRPEAKAEIVLRLQKAGERVAFVGDGINDAPALEQADLGIAVAKASDIAREAADIILLKSDVSAVPEALQLAQATLRTIKQNLFWAFFYNACGIPLAALGFLSPIFSAFAMGASDLIVIGNALRLRRWKPRQEGAP